VRCPRPLRFLALLLALVSSGYPPLHAAEWRDVNGHQIKGDPVDVVGPFALFRERGGKGHRVLLQGLSPEDCVRLYRHTEAKTAISDSFAEATGMITKSLIDRVQRVVDGVLVDADLSAQAEPEMVVVLYGHPHNGNSWRALGNMVATYHRLKRVLGDRIEFVYVGAVHEPALQAEMAERMFMPWLVAKSEVARRVPALSQMAKSKETRMLLFSRNGAPILAGTAEDLASNLRFIDELGDFVGLLNPQNPRTWPHLAHYQRAIRPVKYARQDAEPLLVGDPIFPYSLIPYGVKSIDAQLAIDAEGRVTSHEILPRSELPERVAGPLMQALQQRAVFMPAMRAGQPVDGTYRYVLQVPEANREKEADFAWLSGEPTHEVILNSWLVLRPIQVEAADFSEVDYTAEDGVMVMQAVEVSNEAFTRHEQMSAFSSNWFDAEGAGSVNPRAGDAVKIMGSTLKWERLEGELGLVDLQKGMGELEYTIGYAWLEFDSPQALPAWLGIGSDDGLKIWHNGELVHDKWVRRESRIDDDIVPLKLSEGRNTLLVKIQNAWGDWSFISRLRIRGI
jgi:hypothetical protein